ncbi:MAG TPA: hypothetical protein VFF18_01055 [Woeseiaceae bacterium]|nr:hypothetical protein [Woeseiaceae bacterium]
MTDGQTAQTAAPHSGRQAGAFMGAVIVAHNDRCSDRAPGLRDRLAVVRNWTWTDTISQLGMRLITSAQI